MVTNGSKELKNKRLQQDRVQITRGSSRIGSWQKEAPAGSGPGSTSNLLDAAIVILTLVITKAFQCAELSFL